MDDRRKEHDCIHEGELAVLMTWMNDTKKMIDKIQSIFLQNFVQMIIMVGILVAVVWKLFAK